MHSANTARAAFLGVYWPLWHHPYPPSPQPQAHTYQMFDEFRANCGMHASVLNMSSNFRNRIARPTHYTPSRTGRRISQLCSLSDRIPAFILRDMATCETAHKRFTCFGPDNCLGICVDSMVSVKFYVPHNVACDAPGISAPRRAPRRARKIPQLS